MDNSWQYFQGSFCTGQSFEPTLAQLVAYGQIFIVVNGQIVKNQSDHLVTLFTNLHAR